MPQEKTWQKNLTLSLPPPCTKTALLASTFLSVILVSGEGFAGTASTNPDQVLPPTAAPASAAAATVPAPTPNDPAQAAASTSSAGATAAVSTSAPTKSEQEKLSKMSEDEFKAYFHNKFLFEKRLHEFNSCKSDLEFRILEENIQLAYNSFKKINPKERELFELTISPLLSAEKGLSNSIYFIMCFAESPSTEWEDMSKRTIEALKRESDAKK